MKKKYITLFMLFINFVNIANAKQLIGLSTFPIQSKNFEEVDCKRVIKMVKGAPRPAIAILYNTFGSDEKCLKKFWEVTEKQGKKHITEIHFSNEAGRRTGNVDRLDLFNNLNVKQYNKLLVEMPEWVMRRIKRRVLAIHRVVRSHKKHGYFILSTGLEDNFSKQAWENLYEQIRKYWHFAIARSGVKRKLNAAPYDVWDERHSYFETPKKPNRCIMNGDGQDVDFLIHSGQKVSGYEPATYKQVKKWLNKGIKNNCIMFIWIAKWQGIVKNKPVSKPLDREAYYHKEDLPVITHLVKGKTLKEYNNTGAQSINSILTY